MGKAKRREQLRRTKIVEEQPPNKLEVLALLLAKTPEMARDFRRPGSIWVFDESPSDRKLFVALQPFRKACNAFYEGPYRKLSEPVQSIYQYVLMRYQLAYYWVTYDWRIRHLFHPYCEAWAVKLVESESSLVGSFVRAIEADLRTCLLLETVGERQDGYKRFGQVLLDRFKSELANLAKAPNAQSPTARKTGRDLCAALVDYESWLEDPIRYAHLMPANSDPVDDMRREAQFLVQQGHKRRAALKWLLPWTKTWRAHFRVYALGKKLITIQIDGDELVQLSWGVRNLYSIPQR